jgi:hypothetical protein
MKILSLVVRLVLLQAVFLPAFADSLEAVEAERQQLQFEGSRIESACYDRFAVNACLSKWGAERRARAAALRKRELALRDAERTERTREQLERLEDKKTEQTKRLEEMANDPVAERVPKTAPVPQPLDRPEVNDSPAAISPEQAQANRAAFDAKLEEAARRKAEVEKRIQDKPDRAEPLPINQ